MAREVKLKVAFDVDGTLFNEYGKPRKEIVDMLIEFATCTDIEVYVWSGGGVNYAEQRVRDLGIEKFVKKCYFKAQYLQMDICFDDQQVDLAKTNIKV